MTTNIVNHKDDVNQKWIKVLERLEGRLSKSQFSHFKGSTAVMENDGSLTVSLPPIAKIEAVEKQLERHVNWAIGPEFGMLPLNYQTAFPSLSEPIPPPPPIRDTEGEFSLLMAQERSAEDVISFKRIYVVMAGGDTLTGLILSNIVWWHTPNKEGKSKLKVVREDEYWIARTKEQWSEETTMSQKQVTRSINKLETLKLIIKKVFKFNNDTVLHVRLNKSNYVDCYHKALRD